MSTVVTFIEVPQVATCDLCWMLFQFFSGCRCRGITQCGEVLFTWKVWDSLLLQKVLTWHSLPAFSEEKKKARKCLFSVSWFSVIHSWMWVFAKMFLYFCPPKCLEHSWLNLCDLVSFTPAPPSKPWPPAVSPFFTSKPRAMAYTSSEPWTSYLCSLSAGLSYWVRTPDSSCRGLPPPHTPPHTPLSKNKEKKKKTGSKTLQKALK